MYVKDESLPARWMIPIMIEQRIMSLDNCTWLYPAQFYSCPDLSVLVSRSQTTKLCCPIHSLTRSGFFRETRTGLKVAGNSNFLVCSCHSESNYYTATVQYIAVRSLVFFVKKERDSKLFPTPDRWMARLRPTTQHSTGPLTTSLWGCWGHTVVWNGKNLPVIISL